MIKKSVDIKNSRVFYYQSDDYNPNGCLVFLHGWGANIEIFKPVLEKCNNYIDLDLPCFGLNKNIEDKDWDIFKYVDFLKNFLEELNIKDPILVGHSFGGAIVAKYCSLGGRAKKIVLVSSAGIPDIKIKRFVAKACSYIVKFIFVDLLPTKHKEIFRKKFYNLLHFDLISIGELRNNFLKLVDLNIEEDFKKIKIETIIIWGENDIYTPLRSGKKINRLIKNSKLFVIPRASHLVFFDKPDEFNKIFLNAINKNI